MKKFLVWLTRQPLLVVSFVYVALALVLFTAGMANARAGDATLTWTLATHNTDGTTIPTTGAGSLTQTSVIYGLCNATSTGLLTTPAPVTLAVPVPATTRVITGLGNGNWCFAARSDTATAQSAFTSYVAKSIILIPNPPGGLTVTVSVAYMATRQDNHYVMLPMGTVPGGTPCDSTNGMIVNGKAYFAVPFSAVSWYGSTQSTVVMATCS